MRRFLCLATALLCACSAEPGTMESPAGPLALSSASVPLVDAEGLYGGGSNEPPAFHFNAGLVAAAMVPDSGALFVSMGMSSTRQVWNWWVQHDDTDAVRFDRLGACAGCTADSWDAPTDKGWQNAFSHLARRGLTGSDVDVVWMMLVKSHTHSHTAQDMEEVLAQIKVQYPNARQVFVSAHPYAGYSTYKGGSEPGFWQSGVVAREFILNHLGETEPWIGWGPYLWADGATANSQGLAWFPSDFLTDGLHPSLVGRDKATDRLEAFFQTSPLTAWYRP